MMYLVDEFFRERFAQRRRSTSVSPAGPPFTHTAKPTWGSALGIPFPVSSVSGVTGMGGGYNLSDCEAEYNLPFADAYWYAHFPVDFIGTWEEFVMQSPDLLRGRRFLMAALADATMNVPTLGERAEIDIDVLAIYIAERTTSSAQQSSLLRDFVGHLREAAQTANASIGGFVELPHFYAKLIGKEAPFAGESIALRFRITIRETSKTSQRYGLQV